ncbi:hypothetical protein [Alysiella crassa]|uniref:Uncharacterized protein n=1 Tax=Alysiella crassa TaxID=153491 RepID=A0A376BTP5_9NEIS|nr:hypothetical protein [Alysiella crassa]UOP05895.1 hypothetical protein LVJ80_08370 [Alysiella crassa]SSY80320.1 Uncharacterised protein [Alysiella crassa]
MESIVIQIHPLKNIAHKPIAVAEFVPERKGLAFWRRGKDGLFSEYPLRPCDTLKEARTYIQRCYFNDKVATEATASRKSKPRLSSVKIKKTQPDLFQAA